MAGRDGVTAHRVPFFDWTFHADNKWWTFDKGQGKTHTRFGRFQDRLFVTGGQICGCLLLVAFRCYIACCLLLAIIDLMLFMQEILRLHPPQQTA